jgi:hypothetical protein
MELGGEGSETWKCVEGGGDYPDAPFNHFIPDSIGTRESCQCTKYASIAIKGSIAHSINYDVLDTSEAQQYNVPSDDIYNDPTRIHICRFLSFSPNHRPRSDQHQGPYRVG